MRCEPKNEQDDTMKKQTKLNRLAAAVAAVGLLSWVIASHAAPPPFSTPPPPPGSQARPDEAKPAVNYVLSIQWREAKGTTNSLEVLTTAGSLSLDSILPNKVKIDDNEVPTTLSLQAELTELSPEKGRLKLFLGRTVPYVTGSSSSPGGGTHSSYQQLRVGLSSTIIVTFGKTAVIQSDSNEEIAVLVTRQAD